MPLDTAALRCYTFVRMQSGTLDNDNLAGMQEGVIADALDMVRARIAHIEKERAELGRALEAAREEERLVTRLLALRRGAAPAEADGRKPEVQSPAQPGPGPMAAEPKQPAVQVVIRELAVAGRPLHISDLMRLLRDHGVRVPGAGTQANLITHLRRDTRIVRPSRGMYGLAAWGLENMPTAKRQKRRTRRVRSTAATERT